MFIGHFGIGFAAKKLVPGLSLSVLFIAAQFLDLLWPNLLLLGLEDVSISPGITLMTPLDFIHYPISHSLLLVLFWSSAMGLLTWLVSKNQRFAMVLFFCVLSHWFLDLIVHRPDLPITPWGEMRVGFSWWNSVVLTNLAEGVFFFGGVYLYLKTTTARNKVGLFGFWALVLFFVFIQAANELGPPPPDVTSIAWAGQLQWIFVVWAYFVDKNRALRTEG